MGQVNLVLFGCEYVNDGGFFIFISGVFVEQLICFGSLVSMVNCVVEGFVCGVVLELLCGLCINVVSLIVVSEVLFGYVFYFCGFKLVLVVDVVLGYVCSVEGVQIGQVYCIW